MPPRSLNRIFFNCVVGCMQVIVSGIGKNHFYFFDVETGGLQRISSSQAEGCPNLSAFTVSSSKEMPLVAFYGHEGNLSLFSVNSRQWVGQLKMNSGAAVESAAISHDGRELYSAGEQARIAPYLYASFVNHENCARDIINLDHHFCASYPSQFSDRFTVPFSQYQRQLMYSPLITTTVYSFNSTQYFFVELFMLILSHSTVWQHAQWIFIQHSATPRNGIDVF